MLDAWFPAPALGSADGSDAPAELAALAGPDDVRRVTREVRLVEIADLQAAPASTEDAWLRLHLLSHRLVRPRTISMDGIFGAAHQRRVDLGRAVRGGRLRADPGPADGRPAQRVTVFGVDKFPRMVDYVLPTGVRIGDADRVRLGAHLAEGTTVMHEGFVNYNAGTLGTSMVEGRISAQRRGRRRLRRRRRRLDHGHPVRRRHPGHLGRQALPDRRQRRPRHLARRRLRGRGRLLRHRRHQGHRARTSTASRRSSRRVELSGADNVLFRRNSVTGTVEAVPWRSDGVALNAALHAN